MEKDTVLLNLSTYNELRDFKKSIEDGYTYRMGFENWGSSLRFIGTDEALKEMSQEIEDKQKEIEYKQKEIEYKQKEIEELKSMSWWKFRKWKASNI